MHSMGGPPSRELAERTVALVRELWPKIEAEAEEWVENMTFRE
jgi:hypothetical protein